MSELRALVVSAVGVAFVRSPRYLAERIADAVDAKLAEVRDEQRFWRTVQRTYELRASEMAPLQARLAHKYCRNLDLWSALPALRGRMPVFLLHGGSRVVLDCWREEYGLATAFDEVIEAAGGLTVRDDALYRQLSEQYGVSPSALALVDSTAKGIAAAAEAGLSTYRYGTAYGLRRWLGA